MPLSQQLKSWKSSETNKHHHNKEQWRVWQWPRAKALAIKPDYVILIPRTHVKGEGEKIASTNALLANMHPTDKDRKMETERVGR